MRARFLSMMIPEETVDRALGEVHKLDDWVGAWTRAAQRFSAEARREDAAGEWETGAAARRNAAMCYHVAHLITEDDPRTVRALRGSAVQAFSLAVDRLVVGTRKVGIPWRTKQLPAYFSLPNPDATNVPLVVIMNGATTSKEETFLWSSAFRDAGFGVLNLDWPGTGEATDGAPLTSYCDDLTDGLFEFAASHPQVDETAVVLVGISLGGVVALRAAAMDRRIAGVVAVTPPFEPRLWVNSINPIVAQQLVSLAGRAHSVPIMLEDFSLVDVLPKVKCPVLVFGAARDLVIPPEEAIRLTGALDSLGTLVWYEDGGHGLYDRIEEWTGVSARWLQALLDRLPEESIEGSTQVDSGNPESTFDPAVETTEGGEQNAAAENTIREAVDDVLLETRVVTEPESDR